MMDQEMRILYLEDNPGDRELVALQLREFNPLFSLKGVETKEEFLEALDLFKPDLVIVDYNLAGFDVLTVLPLLKERVPGTPVIVVSGTVGEEVAVETLRQGAVDYLLKDRLSRLGPAIERAISEAREKERMRELEKLRDEFISMISHELRTPLSHLKGVASNLQNRVGGELTEKQRELVEVITRNLSRLEGLVLHLLDFSRFESKQSKFKPLKFDLKTVLREIMENFQIVTKDRDIKLQLKFESETESTSPIFVQADDYLVRQIFRHLLDNASRYVRREIRICVQKQKGFVEVVIIDDGPGIPLEKMGSLFGKFSQLERPEGGAGYQGIGLGLAICKKIVDQHGGKIWAENQSTGGASFHFTLPVVESPQMSGGGKKILVVDDEPDQVLAIRDLLEMEGYEVIEAAEGVRAIELAHKARPNLILLDLRLPGGSGRTVLEALRSKEETKRIPVVVQTALSEPGLSERVIADGAQDFLRKPFSSEMLLAKIQALI
ncbi:MAG: response regulator [Deltaproteobacteria bacterium]|nr:response regulator [Deltaproteobacteria bacterium]